MEKLGINVRVEIALIYELFLWPNIEVSWIEKQDRQSKPDDNNQTVIQYRRGK